MGIKKLTKIIEISGKITLKTGLHIGAGKDEVKIGGVDSLVVKDPLSGEPYIPGSSLKGKLRSLLELVYGLYTAKGEELSYEHYKSALKNSEEARLVLKLFGTSGADYSKYTKLEGEKKKEIEELAITRLSFYDLYFDEESRIKWREILERRLEEKTEVKINRITGTSHTGALVQRERVPKGLSFDLKLILKIFDIDEKEEEKMKNMIKLAFKLLEKDSLGGCGSRGYGKVEIPLSDSDFKEVSIEKLAREEEK